MQYVYVGDANTPKKFTRKKATKYTELVIKDDIGVESPITINMKDTVISIEKAIGVEEVSDEELVYVIPCKRFGLYGYTELTANYNAPTKVINLSAPNCISILYLDDDWMLLFLYKGTICIDLNNSIIAAEVQGEKSPNFSLSEVLWVNAETLLSYFKYEPVYLNGFEDYKFSMILQGGCIGGGYTLRYKPAPMLYEYIGQLREIDKIDTSDFIQEKSCISDYSALYTEAADDFYTDAEFYADAYEDDEDDFQFVYDYGDIADY